MEKRVTFNPEYCKSCGLCIGHCSAQIIKIGTNLNTKGYLTAEVSDEDQEKCISCAKCAQICPDAVISVYRPERKTK